MRLIVFLLKCLVGLLASLGFFIVAAMIALIVFVSRGDLEPWELGPDEVPEQAVLTLDLAAGVIEAVPANPLARATLGDVLVLHEAVAALEAAAEDDRIEGVVARLGRGNPGLAQIQELRDAIAAFRARDKFAVAFAETFGEGGHGTLHYYLASAFEQVWVQPSGDLSVTGLAIETPFLREALDDIGVLPRLDHRDEYKGVRIMAAYAVGCFGSDALGAVGALRDIAQNDRDEMVRTGGRVCAWWQSRHKKVGQARPRLPGTSRSRPNGPARVPWR